MQNQFYSNGKLLITGEYVVLDGAKALALPTTFGQTLHVETIEESKLIWHSLDNQKNVWFSDEFVFENHKISQRIQNENVVSKRLLDICNTAKQLNPDFLNNKEGYLIQSSLDFPKDWGLGSSSTLINNIANWAHVDAFELLENTFGGSGYDIACAQHNTPITYQIMRNDRHIAEVDFKPDFSTHLYFVHLNKKQNSRDAIDNYQVSKPQNFNDIIIEVNQITDALISTKDLDHFCYLMDAHEDLISKVIGVSPIKQSLFSDFNGHVKSLGAWGGDFVLVASKEDPRFYFKNKGYNTILPYEDMIL